MEHQGRRGHAPRSPLRAPTVFTVGQRQRSAQDSPARATAAAKLKAHATHL